MDFGSHHLHLRKRLYKNLEKYPSRDRVRRFFDYVMYGVGVLAPLALLPQVIQIYKYKNVTGLSMQTWILLGIINMLWATYGILHREKPIIIANTGIAILDFTIVIGIYLFR